MELDISNKWVMGLSSIPIYLATALMFISAPIYVWIIGLVVVLGGVEVIYNSIIIRKIHLNNSAVKSLVMWLLIQFTIIAVVLGVIYFATNKI